MKESISSTTKEINLGVNSCILIKKIYFPEIAWGDCYKLVASKYAQLKKAIRVKTPMLSEIETLEIITKFTEEDIQDNLDH